MRRFDLWVSGIAHACDWVCRLCMLVMMVLVAAEIVGRTALGISLQLSDELGGYLLVAITFLSLPICHVRHGFHQVTFIRDRLPPRGRSALDLCLKSISLLFAAVLLWQFVRLELTSWARGDQSDTLLTAPLWIPRLPMVVGAAALCLTLIRSILLDASRLGSGARN